MPIRFSFVLCGILLSATCAFAQELLANSSFDTDIDHWEIESSVGGGSMEWSGLHGQPPGALRTSGVGLTVKPDTCYQLETAGTLTFSFDAFMETGGDFHDCTMNIFFYSDSDDCTGNFAELAENSQFDIPGTTIPNQWQSLSLELPIPGDPVNQTGVQSIHPVLVKGFGDANGDDVCIFDNASFYFAPSVTAVPTLNEKALAILVILLAMGGTLILRRVS